MALSVKCHFGSLYSRRVTLVFMRIDIRVVFGTCSDIVLAIFLFQQTWWRFGSVSDFSLEKVFNSIRPVPEQSFVDRTVFPIFVIVELFKWIWYTKTMIVTPLLPGFREICFFFVCGLDEFHSILGLGFPQTFVIMYFYVSVKQATVSLCP